MTKVASTTDPSTLGASAGGMISRYMLHICEGVQNYITIEKILKTYYYLLLNMDDHGQTTEMNRVCYMCSAML